MGTQSTNGSTVEALARSPIQQTLLLEALDASQALIFLADENMQYAAVNETACNRLGYSREELLALRVTDVASGPTRPTSTPRWSKRAHGQARPTSRQRMDGGWPFHTARRKYEWPICPITSQSATSTERRANHAPGRETEAPHSQGFGFRVAPRVGLEPTTLRLTGGRYEVQWPRQRGFGPAADPSGALRCSEVSTKFDQPP